MALRATFHSFLLGILVLAMKGGAYLLTGSVALFSDALGSVISVMVTGAAMTTLWVGARPADDRHPYGRLKAEYLSVILEGMLIVLTTLSIINAVYTDLRHLKALRALGDGLVMSSVASGINLLYGLYLQQLGGKLRSPSLRADGQRLMSDTIPSVGVLIGAGLVAIAGWQVLDPIMAILMAFNILWVGWRRVQSNLTSLLDEAASLEIQALVRSLVSARADGAIEAHGIRTRSDGEVTFVEFYLMVPGDMNMDAICDRLVGALEAEYRDSPVTIHIEPDS